MIRKRTIYIDSDLDKEFAKAAIDAEITFSKMAEEVFRSHLKEISKKRKEKMHSEQRYGG